MRRLIACALFLGIVACQSTTDNGTATNGVTDLGSLPKATSPVVSATSVAMRDLQSASTGVKLRETSSSGKWSSSGKSRSFCEVSRIVRDTYFHASTPDLFLCTLAALSNAGSFGERLYDGSSKYFKFGGSVGSTKIKLRAVKSGGAITTFDLYLCQDPTATDTYVQTGYVGQNLTDLSSTSVTSVFSGSVSIDGETVNLGARSAITGAINKQGQWTSKQLTSTTSTAFGAKSFTSKSTVDQYADRLEVDSFMSGSKGNDTFTNRIKAVVDILTATGLDKFALGNGAARYILSFARTGSNSQSYNNTKSWTGDDQLPLSDATQSSYYSSLASSTPRVVETVSVEFADAEKWGDCGANESSQFSELIFTQISAQLVTDIAACAEVFAGNTPGYIDCYSATGE
jgi:hypothetical protein